METVTRTPRQLGNALRQRRRQLHLTQETLAAQIKLRQSTISDLENSATQTKTGTLLSVLAALDLELVVRPRTKSSPHEIEANF